MSTQVSLERTYTLAEYMKVIEDGARYELVEGKLEEMSPSSFGHGKFAARLNIHLGSYIMQAKLGETFVAETGFVLNPGEPNLTVRAPDLAFVSAARLLAAQPVKEDEFIPFPPDLAVEVTSPSDRRAVEQKKVREYLQYGVKLVWVIKPTRREIEVYRPGQQPVSLGVEDELDGYDVVPGFRLKVGRLFE